MLIAFLKGFGAGSGLIIAIGAQNAFVLSQGIKKNHYIVIWRVLNSLVGITMWVIAGSVLKALFLI